jgi:hypothetical protein
MRDCIYLALYALETKAFVSSIILIEESIIVVVIKKAPV